jgi:hypothetical protein
MVRETIRTPLRITRLLGGERTPQRCLACGGRVALGDEHVVRIHGALLHAGCALYRRRAYNS